MPIRVAKSSSIEDYRLDGYLTEFKVSKNSPPTGKTLLDRKINENYDVIVLDVLRNGEIINSNLRNMVIQEDDILFVKGSFDNFQRLKEIENLVMLADEKLTQDELEQEDNIRIQTESREKGKFQLRCRFDDARKTGIKCLAKGYYWKDQQKVYISNAYHTCKQVEEMSKEIMRPQELFVTDNTLEPEVNIQTLPSSDTEVTVQVSNNE